PVRRFSAASTSETLKLRLNTPSPCSARKRRCGESPSAGSQRCSCDLAHGRVLVPRSQQLRLLHPEELVRVGLERGEGLPWTDSHRLVEGHRALEIIYHDADVMQRSEQLVVAHGSPSRCRWRAGFGVRSPTHRRDSWINISQRLPSDLAAPPGWVQSRL